MYLNQGLICTINNLSESTLYNHLRSSQGPIPNLNSLKNPTLDYPLTKIHPSNSHTYGTQDPSLHCNFVVLISKHPKSQLTHLSHLQMFLWVSWHGVLTYKDQIQSFNHDNICTLKARISSFHLQRWVTKLNHFISWVGEQCMTFFNILKSTKRFE